MSTPVGTHGLSCIGDDDYAAFALSMQCNADAIDAALAEQQAALSAALARPWISVVNSAIITVPNAAAGGTTGPDGAVGVTMRPGSGSGTPITTTNGLPPVYSAFDPTTLWPRGVYLIGATVAFTFTAVTADSLRQLMVYGLDNVNGVVSTTTTYVDLYLDTDYGVNSAPLNGALTVTGMLESDGNLATIEACFTHANVAADASIAVGRWRLWATYLGSGLAI